jgi:hypothetical protein
MPPAAACWACAAAVPAQHPPDAAAAPVSLREGMWGRRCKGVNVSEGDPTVSSLLMGPTVGTQGLSSHHYTSLHQSPRIHAPATYRDSHTTGSDIPHLQESIVLDRFLYLSSSSSSSSSCPRQR